MNELGDFLKHLRGNLSLREVQEGTGISHTYLSTLEKGVDPRTKKPRKPTPEVLLKLARFYKVEYGTLMFLAGYVNSKMNFTDGNFSIETDDVVENMKVNGLSFEERKAEVTKLALKSEELDEQLGEIRNIKSKTTSKSLEKNDLFSLLNLDTDLYYKNKLLTTDEKEKIKVILKTFFE
ncbi:helix-turn-helix domain-containing protein [Pseudalkalibacillus salsuginis]|uniref:helix-turn-helix domain-containing protein n=1 Tax=Pseudalkalibacillus salsuginis TaxID=2910972 RepID=UPI001F283217|nr:helix-turn-helix transcriptional regulator [Pseudalkalibacillus salsuginis]MCF6411498.1 helix-turn-helix domain-containing protein [Pseudalkalibacillus salsuginis]